MPHQLRRLETGRRRSSSPGTKALIAAGLIVLVGLLPSSSFRGAVLHPSEATAATAAMPSHSTTIALMQDESHLVVVNRDANSVSIIRLRSPWGPEIERKVTEIPVGQEPRCVAINPNDREAYVTNGISGTVSVVGLRPFRLLATIPVGTEPRGCALTPDGTLLYVANHTAGTVSIINTASRTVVGAVPVGGNPTAVAITNRGAGTDTVFVTQMFAELIPAGPGEGRDLGKRGVVHAFPAGNTNPAISKITLSPLSDSGFTANRAKFCPGTHPAHVANPIFCPNPALSSSDPVNTNNPQGVFPNQLLSAVIRADRLYVTAIGAQPEPPEIFNANVQALVYSVDTDALAERAGEHVNLNQQIAFEAAAPPPSLDRTFGNDIVAIDANLAGDTFLIVSRGGNQVFRATLNPASGQLNILNAAGDRVDCRLQTGNLPSGVATRQDGTRAYVNNEANFSVTSVNIDNGFCLTLNRDIPSSEPPGPGTDQHKVLVGKLAFFTALGIPDNNLFTTPIRNIVPRNFRGKASKDAWSSCGSCHPDGLSDGVTWFFDNGPRQTKPLDGMFNKADMTDRALLNWSATRGSNTDFNNNSRAVQGGCGFARAVATGEDPPDPCTNNNVLTPANPAIYDHGITQSGSEALDAQTLWIFAAVRALKQPQPSNVAPGRAVFQTHCASCHGGAKWTKSEIFHRDNPAAVAQDGAPTDPGVDNMLNEFMSFTCQVSPPISIKYLEDVGTFDATNPLEIRDNAAASTAFGADGFNVPSLLSVNYHAPYLHRGQAQTLQEVLPLHKLPAAGGQTIANALNATEQATLLEFLKSIDGATPTLVSEGDLFRDQLRLVGPCP